MRGLLILLLVASPGLAQGKAQSVKDPALRREIRQAIERGVAYLKNTQEKPGCWSYVPGQRGNYAAGMTALCVYALAASGVPADDPAIRKGVAWMLANGRGYARGSAQATYSVSLLILALARVDAREHGEAIRKLATRVIEGQGKSGTWEYRLTPSRRGDLSNSQFAILALWTAQTKAGARIPKKTWQRVYRSLAGSQAANGGWSYQYVKGTSSPTMTAAGLFGLVVSNAALHGGLSGLDGARASTRARRGAKALLRKPVPYASYYYCYGLERAATVMRLPPRDWYVAGARHLVGAQLDDGSWSGLPPGTRRRATGPTNYNTSLALLFLARATEFVLTPRDRTGPITARDAKFPETVTEKNLKQAFEAYLLADEESRAKCVRGFGAAGLPAIEMCIERLGDPEEPIRAAAYGVLRALLEKPLLFDPAAEDTDRRIMQASIRTWFEREGASLRWDGTTGRFRR